MHPPVASTSIPFKAVLWIQGTLAHVFGQAYADHECKKVGYGEPYVAMHIILEYEIN